MSEHKTSKVTLKVGMSCASCVAHIEGAPKDLKGVSKAQVNFPAQKARVEYGPERTDLQIARAIQDVGYEVVADKLTLQVHGMRSAHCEGVVRQGVENLPGVVGVDAKNASLFIANQVETRVAHREAFTLRE